MNIKGVLIKLILYKIHAFMDINSVFYKFDIYLMLSGESTHKINYSK